MGEDLLGAIVDDGDAAILVEHAEAVLHGVERGVEFACKASGGDPAHARRRERTCRTSAARMRKEARMVNITTARIDM